MKRCWVIVFLALAFTGCGVQETFETIADSYDIPAMAQARQLHLELPADVAVLTVANEEAGTIYLCDNYTVTVQTLSSGDLDGTLRSVTGYGRDALTVMETETEGLIRYDVVWSCAGEGGDQVGRAVILDDGSYHYVLTAMTDAERTADVSADWELLFQTFRAI